MGPGAWRLVTILKSMLYSSRKLRYTIQGQASSVDQYPLPKPEDLFSTLANRKKIYKVRSFTSILAANTGGRFHEICHNKHKPRSLYTNSQDCHLN